MGLSNLHAIVKRIGTKNLSSYGEYINSVHVRHWIRVSKNRIICWSIDYSYITENIQYEIINDDTLVLRNAKFGIDVRRHCLGDFLGDIRYVRIDYIYKDLNGVVTTPWDGMKMDFDGNIVNKPPKKVMKRTKEILDNDRGIRNRQARSRYHNEKALERLEMSRGKLDGTFLQMEDVFKLHNVSQRRQVIEYFGMDNILATLDAETVDENTIDGRPYSLVKVSLPDIEQESGVRKCLYLRMVNPSTAEIHFEGIGNKGHWDGIKEETVNAALAWRDSEHKYQNPQVLT